MSMLRLRFLLAALLVSAVLAAIPSNASAPKRVYVLIGPPAPIVEVRSGSPSRGHIWVDGYHRWDGRAYVWVPGRWSLPPYRRAVWVPAHWVHNGHHGWYLVEGHWRRR